MLPQNPIEWLAFAGRVVSRIGEGRYQDLIDALDGGRVDSVRMLSEVLDEPDKIIANGLALERQVRLDAETREHNNT